VSQPALKNLDVAAAPYDAAPCAMARISRLALTDFRSYAGADVALDGRPVVITGANGAGKTNFLEALSLIGPGRGLRGARLEELPRIGGPGGWAVFARFFDGPNEWRFGVGADPKNSRRRVCRIDEAPALGPSAFAAHFRCLWLTPAMDRLFMDGAAERRRFLDRMTLAHDAAHAGGAAAYEQAMRQRQRLLDEGGGDRAWLDALERQMAQSGVAIAAARRQTVMRLAAFDVAAETSVFPAATLEIDGVLENALAEQDAVDAEAAFRSQLGARRRLDAEAGRALAGPHRSDLLVAHRDKGQPARLCSTGEQKALLIGLVLSNARALANRPGGAPLILLLDEVAAHLDADRRAALLSILGALGFQTFMTGTDRALFQAWDDCAQHFKARGGALFEQPSN
jgi:DNA replication and repair protein RecF